MVLAFPFAAERELVRVAGAMKLFQLVYCSRAVKDMSGEELDALLRQSRDRNAAEGITGLLVYHKGNIMQALEGKEPNVRAVFGSIQRDERHEKVKTILQTQADEREFGNWAMAFHRPDAAAEIPEGYSDFLNTPWTGQEFPGGPEQCQRLLLFFKKFLK